MKLIGDIADFIRFLIGVFIESFVVGYMNSRMERNPLDDIPLGSFAH
jgi:hypothetical protein